LCPAAIIAVVLLLCSARAGLNSALVLVVWFVGVPSRSSGSGWSLTAPMCRIPTAAAPPVPPPPSSCSARSSSAAGSTALNAEDAFAQNTAGAGGGSNGQDVIATGCTTGSATGGTQTTGGAGGAGATGRSGLPGVQFAGGAGGSAPNINTGAGGGGGGGYFGGGGGAGQDSSASCGGVAGINLAQGQETAGAGGSGFVGAVGNGILIGGDRGVVANSTDMDYVAGVGIAAPASGSRAGGPGLVVVRYDSPEPALSIVKSTTATAVPAVGTTIPYTLAVTNTGNVTMTGIAVTDPNATGLSCPVADLAASATMTCSAGHIVTQDDIDNGTVTNTATVTGDPPAGVAPITPVVSNEVTLVALASPALSIVKSSTATTAPPVGGDLPYTFVVTNVGNVTATDIAVTDPTTGPVSCATAALAPAASATCTSTHIVTQTDIDRGVITNTATATGTASDGSAIAPATSNTVTIPTGRSIALNIVKSAASRQVTGAGQLIAYSFVVTNTGNVTVHDMVITDAKVPAVTCPQTSLVAGAAMTCTATYTTTADDVATGRVLNTATVLAAGPDGITISPISSNQVEVGVTATIPPVPPTPQTPSAPAVLPATGADLGWPMGLGAVLTLLGLAMSVGSRRHTPRATRSATDPAPVDREIP
jgi:uncharacterized repeat protein (TIGR01451 family)